MSDGKRATAQAGFTLIELMISLVLFSIAIAGILSVAVTMTNSFREQRRAVQIEDNVRSSMEFMADAIRQISPAVSSGSIKDAATCTLGSISVVNSSGGPDQIDVVYATGAVVTTSRTDYNSATWTSLTVTDASQLAVGDTLLITDGTTGVLVVTTAVDTTTGVLGLTAPGCTPDSYVAGSYVIRARRARFYVGTFDGVANMLLMDPDADGPLTAEPLAENIEDFQVAIGIDTDNSGGVDSNEWEYSAGTGALTGDIRAIRLTLVARDPAVWLGASASFTRPAAEDHVASTSPDQYRRRVLQSTVEIRNLKGSP
jgi:type IV pilus assembly protein PilW